MNKKYTSADFQNMPLKELENLLEEMYQNNQFDNGPRVLKTNAKGQIVIDSSDPRDIEWYRNDEAYSVNLPKK